MPRLFHTRIAKKGDKVLDTNYIHQIMAPHSSNSYVDPLNVYVFVPLGRTSTPGLWHIQNWEPLPVHVVPTATRQK